MLYGSECWALSRVDARKVDALDQWCLMRILDIRWYHRVSNCEVRHLTEQPPLTTIIQKRRLTLFGHLVRMDKSADARRILTAVPQSEWRRPVGRPYTSWMATLKNDLARHTLTLGMLSNWLWISRCGDYWQQAELCTDGACRIINEWMNTEQLVDTHKRQNSFEEVLKVMWCWMRMNIKNLSR